MNWHLKMNLKNALRSMQQTYFGKLRHGYMTGWVMVEDVSLILSAFFSSSFTIFFSFIISFRSSDQALFHVTFDWNSFIFLSFCFSLVLNSIHSQQSN